MPGLFSDPSKGAKQAAIAQTHSTELAVQEARVARTQSREDLMPFARIGRKIIDPITQLASAEESPDQIMNLLGSVDQGFGYQDVPDFAGKTYSNQLADLISKPATTESIIGSPTYKALADEAQNRVFANAAARGKVGSGGTADALQEEIVKLAPQLATAESNLQNQQLGRIQNLSALQQGEFGTTVGQRLGQIRDISDIISSGQQRQQSSSQQKFNELFQLLNLSQSSAAGQANTSTSAAANIGDLRTQAGNATASGLIGAQNAKNDQANTAMTLGTMLYIMSDENTKENVKFLGDENNIPLFEFSYINDDSHTLHIGTMAQAIEHDFPCAIKEVDGLKMVNYDALPLTNTTKSIIIKTGRK